MEAQNEITVTIELIVDSEPIAGTADDGHGRRPFVGWLALIRVLERARAQDARSRGS